MKDAETITGELWRLFLPQRHKCGSAVAEQVLPLGVCPLLPLLR